MCGTVSVSTPGHVLTVDDGSFIKTHNFLSHKSKTESFFLVRKSPYRLLLEEELDRGDECDVLEGTPGRVERSQESPSERVSHQCRRGNDYSTRGVDRSGG